MVGTRNVQGVPTRRGVARRRGRSPSLWKEGLARGACRRLSLSALGAATVMVVALRGGEDVAAGRLGEGLEHDKVCLQVTLWIYDVGSTILRP